MVLWLRRSESDVDWHPSRQLVCHFQVLHLAATLGQSQRMDPRFQIQNPEFEAADCAMLERLAGALNPRFWAVGRLLALKSVLAGGGAP